MRKNLEHMEKYRIAIPRELIESRRRLGTETIGAYRLRLDGSNQVFQVLASVEIGEWEHISVSIISSDRVPKWSEMCQVKEMFFEDDEYVTQFHPAKRDYVSLGLIPNILHMWRNRLHPLRVPDSLDGNIFDRKVDGESI